MDKDKRTLDDFHGQVIGHGHYKYRVNTRWSQADPKVTPVKNCHEMVMDKQQRLILLTDHSANNIIIYNSSGQVTEHWTLDMPGAHGLTINEENGDEYLYICCFETGRVVKTDLNGKIVLELAHPKDLGIYPSCDPYKPTETAVAPNGDIYVADGYGSQWILQYNAKGEFIRKFGGKSVREGYFLQVHGVTLDTRDPNNPQLICTARIKNAFKFYTLDGKYIRTLYLPGALVSRAVIDDGMIYTGVCFSSDNTYGVERNTGFVMVIDENEKVVSNPGGTKPDYVNGKPIRMVQELPVFKHPHDVCVDQQKNLFIPQWNADQTYPVKLERV
ncbi:hypothetical protein [Catenovulum adriaticum]|uniref:6-bladed beta-propeller n=1 Tax=Catenovulum adriaticum TaxID=2984846 RepID=A0ABY7AT99_9ALTE|nr:hypothetical protein [Catenovulum sp. TS8]WAJ71896.1 hypothetical protein OLW01_14300 [Catenovulum sp. TS8]